ncbi:MAG: universal stress protein [Terrimesophilobacter sp.]
MNTPATETDLGELVSPSASGAKPRIVVGLDGSTSSDGALRYAARLAKVLDTSLEGVIAWSSR